MDMGMGLPSRTFRDPLATWLPPTPVPRGSWPQGRVQVPKGERLLRGDTLVPLTGKPNGYRPQAEKRAGVLAGAVHPGYQGEIRDGTEQNELSQGSSEHRDSPKPCFGATLNRAPGPFPFRRRHNQSPDNGNVPKVLKLPEGRS